jgi:hypothetical protein
MLEHSKYVVETCWDWAKVEEVRAPTSMGIDSYAPFAVRLAYELVIRQGNSPAE